MDEEMKAALRRKALGFDTDEVVEEYAFEEGEAVLLRRKVTKKTVPPDVSDAKMLTDEEKPLALFTAEELAAEKRRLLALLRDEEEKK